LVVAELLNYCPEWSHLTLTRPVGTEVIIETSCENSLCASTLTVTYPKLFLTYPKLFFPKSNDIL